MVNERQDKFIIPLEDTSTSATTPAVDTKDYRNVVVTVAYDASFAGTIKFLGSVERDEPDYSSAKSITNRYSEVQVKDRQDDQAYDGDTGVVVSAGSSNVEMYEFNANLLNSIAVDVTRTAGTYTITVACTTNG